MADQIVQPWHMRPLRTTELAIATADQIRHLVRDAGAAEPPIVFLDPASHQPMRLAAASSVWRRWKGPRLREVSGDPGVFARKGWGEEALELRERYEVSRFAPMFTGSAGAPTHRSTPDPY